MSTNDLRRQSLLRGGRPGDRLVKHEHAANFRPVAPGVLTLRERATPGVGGPVTRIKHALLGDPLATAALPHERLTKVNALAVFSSDVMSSVPSATEDIM